MGCIVGANQPPASSISGNIGVVRAKVVIYDNDPLLARPHQSYSFHMSNASVVQMKNKPKSISFQADTAFLEPIYIKQDMFVGTRNSLITDTLTPGLDLVQDGAVKDRLPGGIIYDTIGYAISTDNFSVAPGTSIIPRVGKHIFPHQLWFHIGSLLKSGVPLHPSEYDRQGDSLAALSSTPSRNSTTPINRADYFGKWTPEEIEAAPKWAYRHDNDNGVEYFTPAMEVKQTSETVHWTLEKYTPLWQGQDFFVTIAKGTKETDDAVDKRPANEIVDTNIDRYKYLIYDPQQPPSDFVPGISNQAFYELPQNDLNDQQQSGNTDVNATRKKALEISRDKYWWKKNTYILIEVGNFDTEHNYFIELVKGRNPRFLVMGEEWDNPKRLTADIGTINPADFKLMWKCRNLSTYSEVSATELFKQKEISIAVRNHLGKIIITFGGHEGKPWIIQRQDNDPTKYDFSKTIKPMVVPYGTMRIHGGNISCSVNFAPIHYTSSALLRFEDRQMTTIEAKDKDLYMTFSNIGNSFQYTNKSVRARYFRDPRITEGNIGYSCDAYETVECLQNRMTTIPIYQLFDRQYKAYGRGWIVDYPRDNNGNIRRGEDGEPLALEFNDNGIKLRPSRISIVNISGEGQKFRFGIPEQADDNYPYKDLVSKWDVGVRLKCGSMTFNYVPDGSITLPKSNPHTFYNVITPIVGTWKLMVLGGAKPMRGKVNPIDISELVMSIRDGWSANDFNTISHEAQVSCYIPIGVPTGSQSPSLGSANQRDIYSIGQQLLSLHDKTFYLSISYWWENGVGERDAVGNSITRNGPPNENDLLIQLTGLAYGASFERSANKLIMNFTVKDYMSIFEKQFIFNSPFFDAVPDVVAVYELAKLAGFDDDTRANRRIDRRPLGYLQKVIKDNGRTASGKFKHNGEQSISRVYNLKGSYADIANPAMKFSNGDTYDNALKTIATQSSKTVYFDRWGVLKLEDNPALQAAFQGTKEEDFKPVFQFVTSPLRMQSETESAAAEQPHNFVFDPNKHASHLVFNVVRYHRDVEDAVNQLVIVSASNDETLEDGTKTAGLIMKGYTFFEQILDPKSEGFFGFKKPFYQSDGIFGSEQGVANTLSHYAKFKYPPMNVSFETFGLPGLKALDIISLDNNLYFINEISHEIDPSDNSWWCTLSCSWFKPFRDTLGFATRPAEEQEGGTP